MMPVNQAALLVARFLKSNHYDETLEAFIREAGLDSDAGSVKPGDWTVEQIIREKQQFDASLTYEKKSEDTTQGWTTQAPSKHHEPQISIHSNVLCVHGDEQRNEILVTCADKSLRYVTGSKPFAAVDGGDFAGDSPTLSVTTAGSSVLSTAMSGHLSVRDRMSHNLIDECRHHSKYAVQVASFREDDVWMIATAGWDSKILFYMPTGDGSNVRLGEVVHSQTMPTNPESIFFVRHPETHDLHLVASRRDSTHLYYFKISLATQSIEVTESGRQNLAPHSNAWIAFTPCSLSQAPNDPTLVAVATSHTPHMKLIVVRLLFPGTDAESVRSSLRDQASVAREELARQDREDVAIKIHVTTMAPQTPYSTPQVVWRPDASGLFVNGDDGVIRGIEASSGKVVTLLQGHEVGSKVRTLWAGRMKGANEDMAEEVLVSGGFDKKMLVWTI